MLIHRLLFRENMSLSNGPLQVKKTDVTYPSSSDRGEMCHSNSAKCDLIYGFLKCIGELMTTMENVKISSSNRAWSSINCGSCRSAKTRILTASFTKNSGCMAPAGAGGNWKTGATEENKMSENTIPSKCKVDCECYCVAEETATGSFFPVLTLSWRWGVETYW